MGRPPPSPFLEAVIPLPRRGGRFLSVRTQIYTFNMLQPFPEHEGQLKGQMDIYDCIRVAETGLDGKPPVPAEQPERRSIDEPNRGKKT